MLNIVELKIVNPLLQSLNGIPERKTAGAAAVDMVACIENNIVIRPNNSVDIPSGFAINIKDKNYAAVIIPRSGLGRKGLIIGNGTGLIDSDYQGEIKIVLWNRTDKEQTVIPGERVCQMLFVPVALPTFSVVENFSTVTERGEGGFGSTGKI